MIKSVKRNIIIAILSAITCVCMGFALALGNNVPANAEGENTYITGATIALSENIVAKYKVANIPEGYTTARMDYSFGYNNYFEELQVGEATELTFSFKNITPNTMNREVNATLTLSGEGMENITEEYNGFSVVNYAKMVFKSKPADLGMQSEEQYAALRTLLADLLNYGSAAQGYRNTDVANYAIDQLVYSQRNAVSEFVAPTETDKTLTGTASAKLRWYDATLRFGDKVDVAFRILAKDAALGSDTLGVKVQKEDGAQENAVLASSEAYIELAGTTLYTFVYEGLSVTEFNDLLTVKAYVGDAQEGKTLTYSVKSYVYETINNQNATAEMQDLAKKAYTYGASVSNYLEALQNTPVVDDPTVTDVVLSDDITEYLGMEGNRGAYTISKAFGWETFAPNAHYSSNMTSDGTYLYMLATNGDIPASTNQTDGLGQGVKSRQARIVKVDPTTGTVLGYTTQFWAQGGGNVETYTCILYKGGYVYAINAQNEWKKVEASALTTNNVALSGLGADEVAFFTKSTPANSAVELDLRSANGVVYNESKNQFAVKVGTTVNIYNADGTLAKSFNVTTAANNKITANDTYIFMSYKGDGEIAPKIYAYKWDGTYVGSIIPDATGLSAMFGTSNANLQGLAVCGKNVYVAGLRWSVTNSSIILKISVGTEYHKANVVDLVLEGTTPFTTTDRNFSHAWQDLKGMATNMTSNGKYLYRLHNSRGELQSVITRWVDGSSNNWVKTSGQFSITHATSGWEDSPLFCYNGYVYVVKTGGQLAKVVEEFEEGAVPTDCADLTFYNSEGVAFEWSKIGSVQYDEKTNRFAFNVGTTVYICEENGTYVTSFVPAQIGGLKTFSGGTTTGSMIRLAGENGRLYVQMSANFVSAVAFHVYDFKGTRLGLVNLPANVVWPGGNLTSGAKIVGFGVIGDKVYYNCIKWAGTYCDYLGVVQYEYQPAQPTYTFGEYAETIHAENAAWNNENLTHYFGSNLAGTNGWDHGFASDGKYFYTSKAVQVGGTFKIVVSKVARYNNAVVATVTTEATATNSYTYNGRLFVKDGYLYVIDGSNLYRVNCEEFSTSEQVTDFTAFTVSGVTTVGYSAEKDAYVYVKSGNANLVKSDGTVLASNIACGEKLTGCYADGEYAYVLYEAGANSTIGIRIIAWDGTVVYNGTCFSQIHSATNSNIQGMAVIDGEVYFMCIKWSGTDGASGTHIYKAALNY